MQSNLGCIQFIVSLYSPHRYNDVYDLMIQSPRNKLSHTHRTAFSRFSNLRSTVRLLIIPMRIYRRSTDLSFPLAASLRIVTASIRLYPHGRLHVRTYDPPRRRKVLIYTVRIFNVYIPHCLCWPKLEGSVVGYCSLDAICRVVRLISHNSRVSEASSDRNIPTVYRPTEGAACPVSATTATAAGISDLPFIWTPI